ncbi:tetratricopeptide repeat protein [Streptomyces sp. NPDC023838]|uniref:AfsR/SARP family transcriptional regulator n=1 Tax=Streptomyces sp. NPDC023838 TaxID=3154325 RepID=UPI00340919C0
MKFGLLGPLSVRDDHGAERTPASPKGRALLTALLLAPGRAVPLARLETALWGEHPPASARASLHNHLLRLRRSLGEGTRIRAVPGGMQLDAEDGELDTRVFAERLDAARAARLEEDWDTVVREADAALALWRGNPLDEFPALAEEEHARLEQWQESRIQALEWRCDAELRRGRYDGLLPELARLVAEFPLREAFPVQLMRALHRAGRRAEALAAYHRLRRTLIDELGVEPGVEAAAVYQAILTDDGGPPAKDHARAAAPAQAQVQAPAQGRAQLQVPAQAQAPAQDRAMGPVSGSAPAEATGQAQALTRALGQASTRALGQASTRALGQASTRALGQAQAPAPAPALAQAPPPPPDVDPAAVPTSLPRDVTAFTGREREVEALVSAVRAGSAGGVVGIHAVDGMPGVGKTAFAVHVAHRLAPDFPDGSLFLSLHAHTHGTPPVDLGTALTSLLLALGTDPQRIPADLSARAGLWRGKLAGGRYLVLLDDARGSDQVEPLLPGAPGSLVLVTSRRRLVALEDAVPVTLDVLPEDRAVRLLVAKAGRADLTVEDPGCAELARLCGHLPLALHLTAARLRHHRAWSAEDVIADLAAASGRLAALSSENVSVRAAFELSYRALSPDQQLLFCRLGRQPGLDFDAYAVAALHGTDLPTARRLLEELEDHHLVEEPSRGRYRMHDLVRDYARALTDADADADAVHQADHEADHEADHDARRCSDGVRAVARQLDYYLHAALGASRSFARFDTPALTPSAPAPRALPPVADEGRALAWMRAEHANLSAAVAHAARHGHGEHAVQLPAAMAEFMRTHGYWGDALALHRTALGAALLTGDALGRAVALRNTAVIEALQAEYARSEANLLAALDIFRGLRDPGREAIALHGLSSVLRRTGRYEEAQSSLLHCLRLFGQTRDARGQAQVLIELGHVQQLTGRFAEAADSMGRALELHRALDNRLGQANALTALGDVRKSTGAYGEAVSCHRRALVLFRDLGNDLGEANVLSDLGDVLRLTGAYEEALESVGQALRLYQSLGARLGAANALAHRGRIKQRLGRPTEGEKDLQEALDTCRSLNSRMGQAYVLMYLAQVRVLSGSYTYALENATASVELCREIGDLGGEAEALNTLGAVQRADAAPAEALDSHRRALELAREVSSPYEEARALEGLGEALNDLDRTDEAIEHLTRALELTRTLQVPDARRVEARLDGINPPG